MNLKKEFNRLTGMFDHSMDRVHDLADDFRHEARHMSRRAQKSLHHGKDRLSSMENTVVEAMREKPQFFVLAAICLLTLIIAKVVMDQNDRQMRIHD